MSCVLSGLETEYLSIVCQIEKKDSTTWQELYATLFTFENTLIRLNVVSPHDNVENPSANYVYNRRAIWKQKPEPT